MTRTIVKRTINAPIETVFKTVADINNFSQAVPHIVKVEILSDIKSGVGARFRETRLMRGKEVTEEFEVTEYTENDSIRIVTDSHGTVWDTLFTVEPKEGQAELTMIMDAKAYKLFPRLINPLVKGIVKKAIAKDMDAVKAFCEN